MRFRKSSAVAFHTFDGDTGERAKRPFSQIPLIFEGKTCNH